MEAKPEIIHAELGPDFFDPVAAAEFPKHILRYRNLYWASRIGLGGLSDADWTKHFGNFDPLPGSFKEPLALRYHGHQFQVYNHQLGDGRGFLFAQFRDLKDGRLFDLGTKGSGQTPWSREGDGRLTLKGGVREVLAAQMLEALGVQTSKTFSLIETGEALFRGDEPSPTRSSVLVRLSHSHIRIGSFQRLAALGQHDNIIKLINHCLRYYMPESQQGDTATRVLAFMRQVIKNVARTGAEWTAAGFVHGVLNTDNINITGESFDYGPWRFLSHYDPNFTAAYFDHSGLYAFGRQPETLLWNLARLAECFLELAEKQALEDTLSLFWPHFQLCLAKQFCRRLGLIVNRPQELVETGLALIKALIQFWDETKAPFEQVMFDLRGGMVRAARWQNSPNAPHYAHKSFKPVQELLQKEFSPSPYAKLEHPYFQQRTPLTMLVEDVEAIWQPIAEGDDWQPWHNVLKQIDHLRDAYA